MALQSSVCEKEPLNRQQIILFLLLLLVLMLEGIDVKLLAFAAPLMIADWGVTKLSFSASLAAALVGMIPGASLGGILGDRVGRRPVVVYSALTFGVGTILCACCHSVFWLSILRFASGLGFGGILPNAYALIIERMPVRLRTISMSIIAMATPMGGVVGGAAILTLLPRYGWQASFVVFGLITTGFAVAMIFGLRDASTELQAHEIAQFLPEGRDDDPATVATDCRAPAQSRPAGAFLSLFEAPWVRVTGGTSLMFFLAHGINYVIGSWLTVILLGAGMRLETAIGTVVAYNLFLIFGGVLAVNLSSLTGSRVLLAAASGGTAIALFAFMTQLQAPSGLQSDIGLFAIVTLVSLIGLALGSILALVTAVATAAYPESLRTSGVGFAVMWGRIGAVVAIVSGGALIDQGRPGKSVLLLSLTLAATVSVAATFIIDRHTRRS